MCISLSSGLPAHTLRHFLGPPDYHTWGVRNITYMAGHIATIRFQPSKNPSLRLRGTPDVVTVSAISPIGGLGALALDSELGPELKGVTELHKWIELSLLLTDVDRPWASSELDIRN